ncbi:hypothetical protein ABZ402_44440 [Streptomyces mirabilis]|uniref:hypothetical protein n=1 Tax=Streptomyces mirabilis TaxID=68239 RepID=UPI0033F20787
MNVSDHWREDCLRLRGNYTVWIINEGARYGCTERQVERFLVAAANTARHTHSLFSGADTVEAILAAADLHETREEDIVLSLLGWGYVSLSPHDEVNFLGPTPEGVDRARELQRVSQLRAERDIYLHNTLVGWAYRAASAGGTADLRQFLNAEESWFSGSKLTLDEAFAAAIYLHAEGLVIIERVSSEIRLRMTNLGINFVHFKLPLRDFMATQLPRPASAVTNHYSGAVFVHGDANNSKLAGGSHNSQAITHGVPASDLTSLVSQLRQVMPVLDLPEDDAQDLAEEIDALEREGAEPGRGRRIWRSINRILAPAVTSAVTAGSEQAVQAAITAGTELFS